LPVAPAPDFWQILTCPPAWRRHGEKILPHSLFTIKEVAAYLHVSQDDIAILVKRNEIPHKTQGDHAMFRRSDIDAWASQRILNLPEQRLTDYHSRSSSGLQDIGQGDPLMPRLFTVDRIDPHLTSRTKASTIQDLVRLAEKTDLVSDPRELLRMIEEREKLCSTALAGGLALLHPRHHEPYMFAESFIVLGRTIQSIHFGSADGTPSDLFFLVCCQDDRLHLHALARLCTMCMQTGLLAALRASESAGAMLASLCAAEEEIIRRL
jgi:excisionase family DNA binding protein